MMKKILLSFVIFTTPMVAQAAGFALAEQSASGLGSAFSGMGAQSNDPSTQYYNPATMAFMKKGRQFSIGGHIIAPNASLKNESVHNVTTGSLNGLSVTGNDGGNAGKIGLVPNFYYKMDWNDDVVLGLGVTVPFGLSTEYKDGWIGRYFALESKVETININPAVAWKVNERFSIGGGISVQYVKAKLSNAIDSGSLCYGVVSKALAATPVAIPGQIAAECVARGLTPGNAVNDSKVKLDANDISWGFNLGAVFKPNELTTLGLAYRSMIEQNVNGDAKFDRSAAMDSFLTVSPFAASATVNQLLKNGDIKAQVDLPENVSLSGAFQVTPDLELLADVTWTNWSRFQELRIDFANPMQVDGVTTENWNDSWRYSIGANYKWNSDLTLRTGIAYDQTVISDTQHRTPRIPDQNRTWFALGASWAMSPSNTLDVGYAHLFIKDSALDNTSEASIQHNIRGTYDASVDILSMQLTHNF